MVGLDESAFDPFDFDGIDPIERLRHFKMNGLQVTDEQKQYLIHHIGDEMLPRIAAMTFSKNEHHPTLLTVDGDILQAIHDPVNGSLQAVRVMPNSHETAVYSAMALFLKAGHSIDPAMVKFGKTPQFEQQYKPIWIAAYDRYQRTGNLAANPLTSASNNLYDMPRPSTVPNRGHNAA